MAISTIRDLHKYNHLDFVVLLGGEPGLLPELTHRLAEAIQKLGIGFRIETNASWAVDDSSAQAFLSPLVKLGGSFLISIDAFHESFIGLDPVERAIRTLDRMGGDYHLEIPYLDFPDARHPLDVRTNELLRELERRIGRSPCAKMYKGPVLFSGRAAHKLAPLVSQDRGVPHEVCDTVPWWDHGSQNTLEFLVLDPEGYVSKECGIAIGQVRTQSVREILESFCPERHPILSVLIHKGPIGLVEEAAKEGFILRSNYADKCHLCQEVREALRNRYPSYLVPEHHYVEQGRRS